ncbi:lipase esterase family protein [Dactylonectria estremocensis]|uniref:Lipase esterase family protein n=1 Tax=Dactylonectria estremocensis TaxID=1079267 RepID=A0A9P9IW48_9HYPO|nr:lipase esterase family protein [Dactylonectria estremocensis]
MSSGTELLNQHLSRSNPAWNQVALEQSAIDRISDSLYSLSIEEFRQISYKPPPLPLDVPIPIRDLTIREDHITVRDGASIKVRIYEPLNRGSGHLLFFNIHGGGWTVGSPETEEAQNRLIAVKNNAVVCSVDYRRAPEFPFPYALHDSIDALTWCKRNASKLGVDPQRIIVGGGSAGANLVCDIIPKQAAVITHTFHNDGVQGIVGQMLNIPVTCHPDHFPTDEYELYSYVQNAHAPIVGASRMRKFWANYLPEAQPDPKASPLLMKSLNGLPPTLVQVAGMDPLRDEGIAYAQALRNDKVHVELKVYPGMPHAFYIYPNLEPSREYFQTMIDWMKQF